MGTAVLLTVSQRVFGVLYGVVKLDSAHATYIPGDRASVSTRIASAASEFQ